MEIKDKTTEQLEAEIKKIKSVNGALMGVLIVLVAVCIYGIIRIPGDATFIALLVVAFALSATIPMNNSKVKKIKSELESREVIKS